jgi:hypothetical protein
MEFLKSIKGVLFEDDPVATSAQPDITPQKAATHVPHVPLNPVMPTHTPTTNQPLNADIEAILTTALSASHNATFDYLDFMKVLSNIPQAVTDKRTRFQSANAMAIAMQVTPDILIESAKKYHAILIQEEKNFQDTIAIQTHENITKKEDEITKYDEQIQEKSKLINQLTHEINEIGIQKEVVRNQIVDEKGKIEKSNNAFYQSYNTYLQRIQSDIENITNYLGENNA